MAIFFSSLVVLREGSVSPKFENFEHGPELDLVSLGGWEIQTTEEKKIDSPPLLFFPRILGVKLWGKYSFPHSEKTLGKEEGKYPGIFFPGPTFASSEFIKKLQSTNKPPRSDARRHHFFSQL